MQRIEAELKGVATADQIEAWKKKHGDVFQVVVDNSTAYLKTPDRQLMACVASMGDSNPIKSNELLLQGCWLGGDETIKTDDAKFFGVTSKIAVLVQTKDAEIKKL